MTRQQREDVCERFETLVVATAARLMRTLPPAIEVRELEQVGRTALLEAVDAKYEADPEAFGGYLRFRLRGAMLDFVRANQPAEAVVEAPAAPVSIDTAIAVRAAVARLPAAERKVLEMTYFEERTQAAVGDEMGVSQVRIAQRHRSALKRLRPQLAYVRAA